MSTQKDGDKNINKVAQKAKSKNGIAKATRTVSKKEIIIYAAIAVISIASIIGALAYVNYTKSYVMTFEGKKVNVADYEFYYLLQGGGEKSEEIKEASLTALTDFLVMEKEAKSRGITLTQEENDQLKTDVPLLKSNITSYNLTLPEISDERIVDILAGNIYYERLLEELTVDFVVDEDDFKVEFEDYRENGKQLYVDSQLKYVMTETQEQAEEAREKALAGTPFDDIIKEYSGDYSEETGIVTINLNEISLPEEAVASILASEPMDITEVYTMQDIYAFFEIQTLNFPTDEELEASARELYITGKHNGIFEEELAKWKDAAKYTINQKALDAFDKR